MGQCSLRIPEVTEGTEPELVAGPSYGAGKLVMAHEPRWGLSALTTINHGSGWLGDCSSPEYPGKDRNALT